MIAVSAAALLGASSLAALAAEATGAIASIDTAAGTVTLDDGQTFMLPSSVDAASLQVGQPVKIMYEQGSDGSNTATSVEPAS
ncbi:MAG: DUF1344 domain-containing protein [Bauldia sp.]|nr:DUF1344 domain-containing protein [Bauldia sp.]